MPNGKKRIYVADDDDNIRQVIKTFLMGDDYITKPFFVPAEICEEMGRSLKEYGEKM